MSTPAHSAALAEFSSSPPPSDVAPRDIVEIIQDIQANRQQRQRASPGRRVEHDIVTLPDGREYDHQHTSLSVISERSERPTVSHLSPSLATRSSLSSSVPSSPRRHPQSPALRAKIDLFDRPPPAQPPTSSPARSRIPRGGDVSVFQSRSQPPEQSYSPPLHRSSSSVSSTSFASVSLYHRGSLYYYDSQHSVWRPALATLSGNSLLLQFLSQSFDQPSMAGERSFDLSTCEQAESLRSVPHLPRHSVASSLDVPDSASALSMSDRFSNNESLAEPSLGSLDTFKAFSLSWPRSTEILASPKALERVDWLSKIWDAISMPSVGGQTSVPEAPLHKSTPPPPAKPVPDNFDSLHSPVPRLRPNTASPTPQNHSRTHSPDSQLRTSSPHPKSPVKKPSPLASSTISPSEKKVKPATPPPVDQTADTDPMGVSPLISLASSEHYSSQKSATQDRAVETTEFGSSDNRRAPITAASSSSQTVSSEIPTLPGYPGSACPTTEKNNLFSPPGKLQTLEPATELQAGLSKHPEPSPNFPTPAEKQSYPYGPPEVVPEYTTRGSIEDAIPKTSPAAVSATSTPTQQSPEFVQKQTHSQISTPPPLPPKDITTSSTPTPVSKLSKNRSDKPKLPSALAEDLRRILVKINNPNRHSSIHENEPPDMEFLTSPPASRNTVSRHSVTSQELTNLKDELEAVSSALNDGKGSRTETPTDNTVGDADQPTVTEKIDYMLKITQILLENQHRVSSALENNIQRSGFERKHDGSAHAIPLDQRKLNEAHNTESAAAQIQQKGLDRITDLLQTILLRIDSSSNYRTPTPKAQEKLHNTNGKDRPKSALTELRDQNSRSPRSNTQPPSPARKHPKHHSTSNIANRPLDSKSPPKTRSRSPQMEPTSNVPRESAERRPNLNSPRNYPESLNVDEKKQIPRQAMVSVWSDTTPPSEFDSRRESFQDPRYAERDGRYSSIPNEPVPFPKMRRPVDGYSSQPPSRMETPVTLFPQPSYGRPAGEADAFYNQEAPAENNRTMSSPSFPTKDLPGAGTDNTRKSREAVLEEILGDLRANRQITDEAAKHQAEASQYLLKLDDHYRKDVEARAEELKTVTERLASMEATLKMLQGSLPSQNAAPSGPMEMPQPEPPIAPPFTEALPSVPSAVPNDTRYESETEANHEAPQSQRSRRKPLQMPSLQGPRSMPIRWWGAPDPSQESKARWDAATKKKTSREKPPESEKIGAPLPHGGPTEPRKKGSGSREGAVPMPAAAEAQPPRAPQGQDVIARALHDILSKLDKPQNNSAGGGAPIPATGSAPNPSSDEESKKRDQKLEELMATLRERTTEHEALVKKVQTSLELIQENHPSSDHAQKVVENVREGLGAEIKDFRAYLNGEVKLMLEDVGALREQKKVLESDIAELLAFKNKQQSEPMYSGTPKKHPQNLPPQGGPKDPRPPAWSALSGWNGARPGHKR